jgi:hypothetical protein
MVVIVAGAMLMKESALRPVSLHGRTPSMDRDRQVIFGSTVRLAFPSININVAAPHVCHPTVPFVNVHPRCSHIRPFYRNFSAHTIYAPPNLKPDLPSRGSRLIRVQIFAPGWRYVRDEDFWVGGCQVRAFDALDESFIPQILNMQRHFLRLVALNRREAYRLARTGNRIAFNRDQNLLTQHGVHPHIVIVSRSRGPSPSVNTV